MWICRREWLRRGRRRGSNGVVDVLLGDAMSPDLPPASFDVVAASLVLFFLPDLLAALQIW